MKKIRASIDDQGRNHPQSRRDADVNIDDTVKFTEFKSVTEEELIKTINDLSNKSCGLDPLPLNLLKQCQLVVIGHISKL